MECIRVQTEGGIARVTLARPEVRNAFNETLVRELIEAFESMGPEVRAVVLTGEGKAFCAGADLKWMQSAASLSGEGNARDARALVDLFRVVDESPRVTIARVNGPAIGGGLGLVACCDIAVTLGEVRFGFSEVRLGVVPAVISPFVLRKISVSAARRYFLTGELFDAHTAKGLGLVHEVVRPADLDATVDRLAQAVLGCGPVAVREAKQLIRTVMPPPPPEVADATVELIARLRVSEEAAEGFAAFLQKRPPRWPGSDAGGGGDAPGP